MNRSGRPRLRLGIALLAIALIGAALAAPIAYRRARHRRRAAAEAHLESVGDLRLRAILDHRDAADYDRRMQLAAWHMDAARRLTRAVDAPWRPVAAVSALPGCDCDMCRPVEGERAEGGAR